MLPRPDLPAAGRPRRRVSWAVLVLCLPSGLLASAIGGFALFQLFLGDGLPYSIGPEMVPLSLVLISSLPLGLFAWSLARRGQPVTAALVLLAVPLGAAFYVGFHPKRLGGVGIFFLPFFLAALMLSVGRERRSPAVAAAAVLGFGAIWAGALVPGALEARLREAARAGDERRVERLLGWRVDPDGRDESGVTALMLAIEADAEPVVRALVERGADPARKDRSGRSARMRAIEAGRSELTLYLLGPAEWEGDG